MPKTRRKRIGRKHKSGTGNSKNEIARREIGAMPKRIGHRAKESTKSRQGIANTSKPTKTAATSTSTATSIVSSSTPAFLVTARVSYESSSEPQNDAVAKCYRKIVNLLNSLDNDSQRVLVLEEVLNDPEMKYIAKAIGYVPSRPKR